MLRAVLRVSLRIAVFATLLWLAREGLKRWVDGPEPQPSAEPWISASEAGLPEPEPEGSSDAAPAAWVEPNGTGEPPSTHPVKAKLSSKLYHEPGMAAYVRTRADRYYATAQAAEADGFTRARR